MPTIPPEKDSELRTWAVVFDQRIALGPEVYGLTPLDSAELHDKVEAWSEALDRALDPATRTPGIVAAKRDARKAMLKVIRRALRIINARPDVSESQRADLGLNPRKPERTFAPAPAGKPLVAVDPWGCVRVRDGLVPRRAKPASTFGAALFIQIVDADSTVNPSIEQTTFAGIATRSSFRLQLPAGMRGRRLYVLARWIGTRGELGPVSPAASTTIAV